MYGFGSEQEAAFQKDSTSSRRRTGYHQFTKAGSWDTEIRTKVPRRQPAGRGPVPQPGVMCDLAKQNKLLAYDDAAVTTARPTW